MIPPFSPSSAPAPFGSNHEQPSQAGGPPNEPGDPSEEYLPPTRQAVERTRASAMDNWVMFLGLMCMFWGLPLMGIAWSIGAGHARDDIEQLMPAFVGAVRHPPKEAQALLQVPAQADALDRLEWFHVRSWGGVAQLEVGLDSGQCGTMVRWLVEHPTLATQLRITVNGFRVDPSAVREIPCRGPGGHVATTAVTFEQAW